MSKVTLEDIHECLIGNKLAGQKGIISTIDDLVDNHGQLVKKIDKLDDRSCVIENRISNIEKYNLENKNKISFKIPKWVTAVTGLIIKTKTGI